MSALISTDSRRSVARWLGVMRARAQISQDTFEILNSFPVNQASPFTAAWSR